ncbi:uncharacterized protein LOC141633980 [Silene latifolia]|uniref:uncharacterized protein LOC141633980 n=1 Tax=Silene latifolia TaxID=37657 RepID=UPI003D785CAE
MSYWKNVAISKGKKGCNVDAFYKAVRSELEASEEPDILKMDMVFFVIHDSGHYYVLCIHFKKHAIHILDDQELPDGVDMRKQYGNTAETIRDSFVSFKAETKDARAADTNDFGMHVINMPWKNSQKNDDCGVYVMRHMETYFGYTENWESGFKNNIDRILKNLRSRYCASIILSKANKEDDD